VGVDSASGGGSESTDLLTRSVAMFAHDTYRDEDVRHSRSDRNGGVHAGEGV
jgi:hypothetical protein